MRLTFYKQIKRNRRLFSCFFLIMQRPKLDAKEPNETVVLIFS